MSELSSRRLYDRVENSLGAAGEPVRVVLEVAVQSIKDTLTDSGPQWAASVAYYALLSAFPLALVAAVAASYFMNPQQAAERVISLIGDFIPQGEQEIRDAVQQAIRARGQIGLLALGGLLWTGTRVFDTLTRAMNIAFDRDESYGFFKRILVEVLMLLTIGLFFVFAVLSGFLTGLVWEALQFVPAERGFAFDLVRAAVQLIALLMAFFLIYRFVPRGGGSWKSALAGAWVATALLVVANPLFEYYVTQYSNYNLIYGPIWVLIVILIWIWIVSLITIFGGEVASHVQAIIIDGQSPEDVGRQHNDRSALRRRRTRFPHGRSVDSRARR